MSGWRKQRLVDVILDIKDGGTPSRSNPSYFGGDIAWCVVKDVRPEIHGTAEYLTASGLANCSAKVWPVGSVIISLGATIGEIGIARVPVATKQGLAGIVPHPDRMTSEFLAYALHEQIDTIRAMARGATIKEVRPRRLAEELWINTPPLEEQRRIVTVLDAAFAAIATATANAEKNLASAGELFERCLAGVFEAPSGDWIVEPLKANVRFIDYRGKTPPKREAGVRLITAKNVKMGFIQRQPEEFIDPAAYDSWMTRGFPRQGDVLFTTEAPLGNVAQLDTDEKVVIGQRLITMQPNPDRIDRTFLKYMLCSAPIQRAILKQATGATVSGIKAKLLKEISICYPRGLSEQLEIVERLDGLYDLAQSLADSLKVKIERLANLKQSLLHRAFSGELTEREPLAA